LDAVVLREVIGGREPMRAAADDDHVVAFLQLATRSPHPADEEDVLHCCLRRSSIVSLTYCESSWGTKRRKPVPRDSITAGTPRRIDPAAGNSVNSVMRRSSASLSTSITTSAALWS